ncbi:hypothetical protein TruAng_000366 [Truncatella angustata]|nr:hypothetical protein TruAng_000366 [Truncatella angustata]
MGLTVLSDSDVSKVFSSLSTEEVNGLLQVLGETLTHYSCHGGKNDYLARSAHTRKDGQTSLFMPSVTQDLIGTKIVGVAPPQTQSSAAPVAGLKSVLTLCDATGQAVGILNAAELTAFRTSLGSMLLFHQRQTVRNIVVFGAGKQALWHVKLAAILRGRDIQMVTIINRSSKRTEQLISDIQSSEQWPSHIKLVASENQESLEQLVTDADAIFCTTPSTEALFPAAFLTSDAAKSKTRYIAAIGSYKLNMREIDPEYLRTVVDPSGPLSAQAYKEGVITVDSQEGCSEEAGEIVAAKIPHEKIVEVGELLQQRTKPASADLEKWLQEGLVIYKSVGIGVMDISIGREILRLANSKSIGLTAPDF